MSVRKNSKGLWDADLYYKDFSGKLIKKRKINFKSKKEAQNWVESFKAQQAYSLNMTFGNFYDIYTLDMKQRLRENTQRTKEYVIELKILPFFKNLKMSEITPAHIRRWQTSILKEGYSETYQRMIHNQLSAIFNYAVRYYNLPSNPCAKCEPIGKGAAKEMQFITQQEFGKLRECLEDDTARMAIETMFYTGVRLGEILALTVGDIDFDKKTLSVTKSLQRIKGEDVITEPKTEKSKRCITIPRFLSDHLEEYISKMYGKDKNDRLFSVSKYYLGKALHKGLEAAGLKKIRLHDLRHSHISMLIAMGTPPKVVAERAGHEDVKTTLSIYAHLYETQARQVADDLDELVEKQNECDDNIEGTEDTVSPSENKGE